MKNKILIPFLFFLFAIGGFLLGVIVAPQSTKLSEAQAKAFYYHGVYDECVHVTIVDQGTGKAIDRPPERCAQIVYEFEKQNFLQRFYKTPIPEYIPQGTKKP